MYNTDFVVRYHEIENELIINLHRKFMKKQEEEEREDKLATARAAASKVVAAVVAIANLEKEKEKEREKEKEKELIVPVKKKGLKKSGISEPVTVNEEPKKRGRKKNK
jgi:hypothetical protein